METTSNSKQKMNKVELDRYAGQWVAFVEDKIVAQDDTLKGLTKEMDAKGLRKKASVFLVPRKDEGPYILSLV